MQPGADFDFSHSLFSSGYCYRLEIKAFNHIYMETPKEITKCQVKMYMLKYVKLVCECCVEYRTAPYISSLNQSKVILHLNESIIQNVI